MTPLWFWELPSDWARDVTGWHHWVTAGDRLYFDGQLVGIGLDPAEIVHMGEIEVTYVTH